jgi:mitochondrial import inner membrane translocase subunit TIM50
MPNVPHNIPVPHTLVLDLEQTLVSSTWDRKYGWRHAKRPGVDKFLRTMAEYYEIVLYSPSIDALADPVVTSLDKNGCIMHRLYRDATHYKNGTHVKDLDRLNRNTNRMVLLDDDPLAAQLNPDNLILVKAYEDPMDRTDNTLERITPFLVELARKGHSDIPSILRQYRGMDADQIADEYERRLENLRTSRMRHPSLLGSFASHKGGAVDLPPPEMNPIVDANNAAAPQQLTAKDLVGAAPPSETAGGMVQWMHRRAKEKEEEQMRKMEKWNEVMLKKQQAKQGSGQ